MNRKKSLGERIRGWFPKEYPAALAQKMSKPRWWKPLWIAVVAVNIAWVIFGFFVLHYPIERVALLTFLTFFCIGIAYYIRVRPSMKVNRALYILLGITPIGFSLWMVLAVSGLGRWLTNMVGAFPSLIIGWVVCLGIGALIGDWIGKRRNYQLPLSP
jgi:peptidoglycan/LPS O-acetylase OafA/YrhL